ncbi:MAG: sodium/proton-translocating pyrophosphatase, partial [Akkermansia sp.]
MLEPITTEQIFWMIPIGSIIALFFAALFFRYMKKQDPGTAQMQTIAGHVRVGAMAYLKQQYKIVAIFFVLITL